MMKQITDHLKNLFLSGLVFLLPIAISISIIKFCFNLIKNFLTPLQAIYIPIVSDIPHYEILLITVFIFIIGFALKFFILQPLLNFFESLLSKIPLFRIIYNSTKQLIGAFTSHTKSKFQTVVVVEFPIKGMYSIGFIISNQVAHEISPTSDKKYVNVYIPITPNPAHGFFIMIPEGHYQETDLTHQEATALVISGGIVQPERFKN